jgi:hypothetical protein
MISSKLQKWGALVASLASVLTFSSAAKAIVLTSTGPATTITRAAVSGGQPRVTSSQSFIYTGPAFNAYSIKSVQINGLSINKGKGLLSASLLASHASTNALITKLDLFETFTTAGTASAIRSGNYTFTPNSGSNWKTTTTNALAPIKLSGTNISNFDGFLFDSSTKWTLSIGNGRATNAGTGSFSSFSIDAAVPFESNAAPAGVAIVFGAFVLRRKLQKRSAQNMSLESVNS